ncbi:DUF6223 family protein [Micromonospora robiginosa]|uniref:DUF6223 family protein n=1 Tax=Micromonospora robiginosa TaxID=2749844 RepID=A0A7L6B9Y3_9ACTN|nr:DUF6223 family protein [Micromonospora ferruginea]QLQ38814.1 DUF6223 family protein [Micromonospora ferruginea]
MLINNLLAATLADPHVPLAAGGIGGSGRFGATAFALVSLAGVVIGGLAVRRAGAGGRRALLAVATGLVGLVLSAVHLATTTGGFGTGQGRAGAIVGVVLGLVGVGLGGLALARARRTA